MPRTMPIFLLRAVASMTCLLTARAEAIAGTNKTEKLMGTPRDDSMFGLRGADILKGRGGFDLLSGGPGEDLLRGGDGVDILFGGPGNDNLKGSAAHNILYGGGGNDKIFVSATDSVRGSVNPGRGTDKVYCAPPGQAGITVVHYIGAELIADVLAGVPQDTIINFDPTRDTVRIYLGFDDSSLCWSRFGAEPNSEFIIYTDENGPHKLMHFVGVTRVSELVESFLIDGNASC